MNRLLLLLSLALPGSLQAAVAEPDLLFQSSEMIDITLSAPFALIDSERDKEKQYQGTLSYTDESGQHVVLDAGFQVRGNWRLQKKNCNY